MRALKYLIRWAVLKAVDDSAAYRAGKASAFGKEGNVFLLTPYGLAHNPPAGATVLMLQVGGDEGNKVGIADLPTRRLKGLAPGEAALYNALTDSFVLMKENGDVVVDCKGDLNLTVAGNVTMTASGSVDIGAAGGPAVARVGDMVRVGSGSSAGDWPIISGSSKVNAA